MYMYIYINIWNMYQNICMNVKYDNVFEKQHIFNVTSGITNRRNVEK